MAATPELYTLTELAQKTGISLPTLQRYKKLYQKRIPSKGRGRKQRYPKEAIAVVQEIKRENLRKRGRPKKARAGAAKRKPRKTARKVKKVAAKAARRKPKAAKRARKKAAKGGQKLLTLTEIGQITGISYPTLVRYVKLHLDQIPHEGEGRKRRFPRSAVKVFRRLRGATRRGRRKGTTAAAQVAGGARLARRIRELEKAQRSISKRLDTVLEQLKKPLHVTVRRK